MSTSTHTSEELRELSAKAQPFPPERRLPSNFLFLAPKTSSRVPPSKTVQPLTAEALAEIPKKVESESEAANIESMKRRTSSLSSTGSKSGFRFLRLGHVHHADENKGDFFEVAVE
jgi:hypothetical protein